MPTETIEINGQKHEIETAPVTIICQNGDMRIKYNRIELSDNDTLFHIDQCMKLHPHTLALYHMVFPDNLIGITQEERGDETWLVAKEGFPVGTHSHYMLLDRATGKVERRFNQWIGSEGIGSRHIFGLVDLTLKLSQMGVPVVWIHPETHLHPSIQANLTDLVLAIREEFKTPEEKQNEEINKIKKDIGYKPKPKPDPPELNLQKPIEVL